MKSPYILETQALSHRFADGSLVLDNVNLQVPEGAVYGFLGPNGAGKTTTLRLILGLLQKQQGTVSVLGMPFARHRLDILRQTGAMIESPSLYGHLTAVENLRILQMVYRCPKERIGAVLQLTGLAGTGLKKTARFSLGMKQRLSIAMALLHEPRLLILDEPTNGLDPNGMIEIRELLLQLNRQQGIAILISSHLLAEMEKMVSHTGIIHQGRLLFQGSMEALHSQRAAGRCLLLTTGNPVQAMALLHNLNYRPALLPGNRISIPAPDAAAVAALIRQLAAAGIDIYEVNNSRNDLETIFMNMITHPTTNL